MKILNSDTFDGNGEPNTLPGPQEISTFANEFGEAISRNGSCGRNTKSNVFANPYNTLSGNLGTFVKVEGFEGDSDGNTAHILD